MIKKTDIEKLPTLLRNDIIAYLEQSMQKADETKMNSAESFVVTTDEKQRALALIAQGELNAFAALHNVFKKGMGE